MSTSAYFHSGKICPNDGTCRHPDHTIGGPDDQDIIEAVSAEFREQLAKMFECRHGVSGECSRCLRNSRALAGEGPK